MFLLALQINLTVVAKIMTESSSLAFPLYLATKVKKILIEKAKEWLLMAISRKDFEIA